MADIDFMLQRQTRPAPDTPAEEPGFFDDLLGGTVSALSTFGYVLDTLGRPVRTFFHTGDFERSLQSITDTSKASTSRDLLNAMGFRDIGRRDREFDWGDIADIGAEFLLDVVTDPLSWVSLGATSWGNKLTGAGAKALRGLKVTGEFADVAADFTKATGKILTKERLLGGQTPGLASTLAKRVAGGETGINIGLPFMKPFASITGSKLAAPAALAGSAASALKTTAEALPLVGSAVRLARNARRFLSESSGNQALDIMGQFSNQSDVLLNDLVDGINRSYSDALRTVGRRGDMEEAVKLVEASMTDEHADVLRRLAEDIGVPEEQLKASFRARRGDPRELERQLLEKFGGDQAKVDAVGAFANSMKKTFAAMREVEASVDRPVADLGSLMAKEVRELRDDVIRLGREVLPEAAAFNPSVVKGGAKGMDVSSIRDTLKNAQKAVFARPERKAALDLMETRLKQYEQALDNFATIPGYVPKAVSDDAMEVLLRAERNTPGTMRTLISSDRSLTSIDEANKAIQELGTAATAGRAVKSSISAGDMARAWRAGFKSGGLDGVSKEISRAMEKAGHFHETDPMKIIEHRFQHSAKVISQAEHVKSVRNIFGEELPPKIRKLLEEQQELQKQMPSDYAKNALAVRRLGEIQDELASAPLPQNTQKLMVEQRKLQKQITSARRLVEIQDELAATPTPIGYVKASKLGMAKPGLDDYLLPAEIAESVMRQRNVLSSPQHWRNMANAFHSYNRFWKSLQLSFPGTIMRNVMGNVALMAQGGGLTARTPEDMATVFGIMRSLRKGNLAAKDELQKIVLDLGGTKMTAKDLVDEATALGAVDSGLFGTELADISKKFGKKSRVLTPSEVNMFAENHAKLTHMLGRMRKGDTVEQAALSANNYLFNYRNVSPAVNLARKYGVAPFAAWTAKNIPLQMELLFTKPGQFVALMHARDALESGLPEASPEEMKEFMHDRWGVRLDQNEDGSWNYITGDNMIPMVDIIPFTQAFTNFGEFRDFMLDFAGEDLLGGPTKGVLEAMFNKNLFTKREIQKANEVAVVNIPFVGPVTLPEIASPRVVHIAKSALGRPVATMEAAAKVTNKAINPNTGEPYTFGEAGALMGAVSPAKVETLNTPFARMMKEGELKRAISKQKSAITLANMRGQEEAAAKNQKILNAMQAHLKRVQEISETP